MFTGFATENTPSIQIWDFFRTTNSAPNLSLTDDCAPLQTIRTGGSTTAINLFLPSCPVEGKTITIVNSPFNTNAQAVQVYSSDARAGGSSIVLFTIGQGDTLVLTYSKNFVSPSSNSGGNSYSGWVTINRAPPSAINTGSAVLSGSINRASGAFSVVAGGYSNIASNTYASVGGGYSLNASGTYSTIAGGGLHNASASYSTIGGGVGNTNSGFSGTVAGGYSCNASGQYSTIGGGQNNIASADNSTVAGGYFNQATGTYGAVGGGVGNYATWAYCAIAGGYNNLASGNGSAVLGGAFSSTRALYGYSAITGGLYPTGTSYGYTQLGMMLLGANTTDATATVLTSDGQVAASNNQMQPPNNSAIFFDGYVVGTVSTVSAGNTKSWAFTGLVKKGASAGTIAFVGTPTNTSPFADAGASTWTMAIGLDTTNGTIKFTVTGQAATSIRWVCTMRLTEVSF